MPVAVAGPVAVAEAPAERTAPSREAATPLEAAALAAGAPVASRAAAPWAVGAPAAPVLAPRCVAAPDMAAVPRMGAAVCTGLELTRAATFEKSTGFGWRLYVLRRRKLRVGCTAAGGAATATAAIFGGAATLTSALPAVIAPVACTAPTPSSLASSLTSSTAALSLDPPPPVYTELWTLGTDPGASIVRGGWRGAAAARDDPGLD